jgi:DNA-binding transcriptional ArsR family regulator
MTQTAPSDAAQRPSPQLGKAVSHPTRLRLLNLVNAGVQTPTELAARLGEPLENVAYHVKVLRRLGCLELIRTERRKGATTHFYKALVDPFEATGSVRTDEKGRRALTATLLQEAFALAYDSTQQGRFDARPDRHLSVLSLSVSESGWRQLNAKLREVVELALELQSQADAAEDERVHSTVLLSHFLSPDSEPSGQSTA